MAFAPTPRRTSMRIRSRGALTLLAAASVVVAACSTPAASVAPSEAAPTDAAPASAAASDAAGSPTAEGWPLTGTLKDGSTFTLHPRVAEKLAAGEPINYVFSYGSTAI